MISQFKVPANLAIELPGMTEELRNISGSLNVIKTMQCLAKYTRRKVVQRDLKMVKKCFITAENLFQW